MEKKRILEAAAVCLVFLLLAGYAEASEHKLNGKNQIIRGSPGSAQQEIELQLNAEELLENYDYNLTVPATGITQEEAGKYFERAKKEIDTRFFSNGETAGHVTSSVNMEESYVKGLVNAEWLLNQYHAVEIDGTIVTDAVGEEGELVQADVKLSCGEYKEEYMFSFMVFPPKLSREEQLLKSIRAEVREESEKKGTKKLTLPTEVEGVQLKWNEKKQHLVWKVLLFEIIVIVLLGLSARERQRLAEKERKDQMQLDYSEVVNKLLILLGAGMTLKQSWNKISAQYAEKRKKKEVEKRHIYEEMMITSREISDGESDRLAYQKFGERTDLSVYQRLVRILVQNLQTGSRGLCTLLGQEAESAMEERKALARKLGEEAGTKMLMPLICMLGIVIAIIIVPALMSFQV